MCVQPLVIVKGWFIGLDKDIYQTLMIVNILCDYSLCHSVLFVNMCQFLSLFCQRKSLSSVNVPNKTSERTTLMYMYELLHLRRLEWGNGACESILTVWGNSTVSTKLLPVVDWIAAHKMLPLSSDDAISDIKMLTLSSSSWSCCLRSGVFESVKITVWGHSKI